MQFYELICTTKGRERSEITDFAVGIESDNGDKYTTHHILE